MVGTTISHYWVLEKIGQGGMGKYQHPHKRIFFKKNWQFRRKEAK